MKKTLAILGSTGSIGTQTLEVIENLNKHSNHHFSVKALTCGTNINLLLNQIRKFNPRAVAVKNEECKERLLRGLGENIKHLQVYFGKKGLRKLAGWEGVDLVINGLVGAVGLEPTIAAIDAGINIGLANKETLVIGGELITDKLSGSTSKLIPVDSEHSAIFQCLRSEGSNRVSRLILTASGGALRGMDIKDLETAKKDDVLNHPNWAMGDKITVDSATLVNKGLEVIEAHWLFDMPYERIKVQVHPQSIIHSMVEFKDGSILAQMGAPDMRVPIQYALTYPNRLENNYPTLDFSKINELTFEKVDNNRYPSFQVIVDAGLVGGSKPAVLNAANEILVEKFLVGKIQFGTIAKTLEGISEEHDPLPITKLEDILEADQWGREKVLELTP